MLSISKILLPVDFSDRSKPAAEEARYLAKLFGAEVIVLYVMAPMPIYGGGLEMAPPIDWYTLQRPAIDKRLEPFVEAQFSDVAVKTVSVKVIVNPLIRRTALRAAQQATVEGPGRIQIMDGKGDMKGCNGTHPSIVNSLGLASPVGARRALFVRHHQFRPVHPHLPHGSHQIRRLSHRLAAARPRVKGTRRRSNSQYISR